MRSAYHASIYELRTTDYVVRENAVWYKVGSAAPTDYLYDLGRLASLQSSVKTWVCR